MGKEEEEEEICHLSFDIYHLSLKQETEDRLTIITLTSLVLW